MRPQVIPDQVGGKLGGGGRGDYSHGILAVSERGWMQGREVVGLLLRVEKTTIFVTRHILAVIFNLIEKLWII